MSLPAEIASFSIMISSVIIFLIRVLDKRLSLSLHSVSYRYFSMDTVMSRISSFEITALPNGRIARAISFIGLSSAATRLELIFPHLRHRWMTAHSPLFLTQTPIGSIRPWQSDSRSPGSRIPPHSFPSLSSSWMAKRQLGQWSGSLPCSSAGIVHPQFRHRYVSVFSFPFMAVFPLFVFGIIKKDNSSLWVIRIPVLLLSCSDNEWYPRLTHESWRRKRVSLSWQNLSPNLCANKRSRNTPAVLSDYFRARMKRIVTSPEIRSFQFQNLPAAVSSNMWHSTFILHSFVFI